MNETNCPNCARPMRTHCVNNRCDWRRCVDCRLIVGPQGVMRDHFADILDERKDR